VVIFLNLMLIYRQWIFLVLAIAVLGTAITADAKEPVTKAESEEAREAPKADDAVDCLLPGQIRPLGRQATYLARGQTIRTTPLHCAQRGGQIVSEGRGEPTPK
jgi:hypothetical protein